MTTDVDFPPPPKGAVPISGFPPPPKGAVPISGPQAQPLPPETKDPYLGIRMGGERDSSMTYQTPEGPTWEAATKTLQQLDTQGVPHNDPRYQKAIKDRALGFERLTSGAVMGAGMGVGTREGFKPLGDPIKSLYERATGKVAKEATESLRDKAATEASEIAASREAEAATYKKKLDAVEKAQKQMQQQPQTAEARAHAQAIQQPAFVEEQSRVLASIRDRVQTLQQEYQQAGHSVQEAKMLAEQEEQKIADAEMSVKNLEKEFLAKPQASAEQFGARVRQVAAQIDKKYSDIREQQSGYKQAVEGAGNYQRVDTRPIIQEIDGQLKGIRNPALEKTLTHIKELLTSDERPFLTIRSADSLRKYLDSIIKAKSVPTNTGPLAVDRETLHFVGKVKSQLVKTATDSWQPYKEALGKWRTLSRPLDIVERKGALRKTIDTDPVSTDYALTESQVVGQVLQQAKAGNPVFTRLISESPELRDSARLYFTRDLFGKETVPTDTGLRTWLKANEGALRQLGLYDEFRNMRVARETAQRAVGDAKASRDLSLAEVRKAEASESKVREDMGYQSRLRDKEKKRIEQAQKGTQDPASLAAESEKRAHAATQRLSQEGTKATRSIKTHEDLMHSYRQFETEISVSPPKSVPTQTRAFAKRLLEDRIIDNKKYADMLRQIQSVENTVQDAHALRIKMAKIVGGTAAAVGVPYLTRKIGGIQ